MTMKTFLTRESQLSYIVRAGLIACTAATAIGLSATAGAFTLPETVAAPTGGFNNGYRWDTTSVTMNFNLPDAPNDRWNRGFADAVARWNAVSDFDVSVLSEAADPCAVDSKNGAGFRRDNCDPSVILGSEVLAVTLIVFDPNTVLEEAFPQERGPVFKFLEADIVFNSDKTWGLYEDDESPVAGVTDFRRVSVHELGHVLGLEHVPPDAEPAIMRADISNTEYPQSDDIKGVNARYPALRGGAAAECRQARNLALSVSVSDSVVGTCVSADFVGGSNQQPANRYRFTLDESGVLDLVVTGLDGYQASVALYATGSSSVLASGAVGAVSSLQRVVGPGSYDLVVSGAEPGSDGRFTALARLNNSSVVLVPIFSILLDD